MRSLMVAVVLGMASTFPAAAQGASGQGISVDAVAWMPAPPVLPAGGQMAVLSGDPGKAGPFTVRLKLPAGYKIPAHRHPHTEPVTVISGELFFGSGDKLDETAAQQLGPGGFVDLPANTNHFAFARVETVIQISTEGPFGIEYADPAEAPGPS
jgi:quercetin dioxygenase-like cupin family protein